LNYGRRLRQAIADRVTVAVSLSAYGNAQAGTQEREPYAFESGCMQVVQNALPAEYYSVGGYEDYVAVERKTLDDFVSTGIRSRKRFARELRRLSGYDAACVVVEADLWDILGGRFETVSDLFTAFSSLTQGKKRFLESLTDG
jgi:hypothetical protein